jgi:hypothetical protein
VSANVTFSLCAATGALLISTLSAVKGRWAVAIVFGLLVIGFLLRALEGRREAAGQEPSPPGPAQAPPPPAPAHDRPPPRRIKGAHFKRR